MKSEESLALLYQILEPHFGAQEAKQTICVILSNVIGELQDHQLHISETSIARGLEKYAADFKFASKSDVA